MNTSNVFEYFSLNLKSIFYKLPKAVAVRLEEIRIRVNCPLAIRVDNGSYYVDRQGRLSEGPKDAYIVEAGDVNVCFEQFTRSSAYAYQNELSNGYITVEGGHRIGFCGRCAVSGDKIITLKDISSINVRIARQIKGAADGIMKYIVADGAVKNTLIISPPRCGKTTLLRDAARQLAQIFSVAIADERSEIASSCAGAAQLDLGARADILDGCPKAQGINMLLRAMSPDVIITDEIGSRNDAGAIYDALNAGVKIIASAHGNDIEDIKKRETLRGLIDEFECFLIISNKDGKREITMRN